MSKKEDKDKRVSLGITDLYAQAEKMGRIDGIPPWPFDGEEPTPFGDFIHDPASGVQKFSNPNPLPHPRHE
jgi:hypothetical protein